MNNSDGAINTKTYPITFLHSSNAAPTVVCMGRGSATTLTDATVKTSYVDKFEWCAWINGAAATSANNIGVYWIAIGF